NREERPLFLVPKSGHYVNGLIFGAIENINAGNGNDVFHIGTDTYIDGADTVLMDLPTSINGGGGTNTLIGHNQPNTWNLNTTSTLNDALTFTNMQQVVGGNDVDTF